MDTLDSKQKIIDFLDSVGVLAVDVFLPISATGRTDDEEVIQFDKEAIAQNGYMEVDWFGTITPTIPTLTFVSYDDVQHTRHQEIAKKIKNEFQYGIRIYFKKKY
jgi:hypothetical protein